jgi:hypothetical protein
MHCRRPVRTLLRLSCGVALIGVIVFLSGQHQLLSRATRVYAHIGDSHYYWLSDHELLLIQGGVTRPDEVDWHMTHRDFRSGIETPLAGLQARFPHDIDAPDQATVSPDGHWLLWRSAGHITAASLDGTQELSWEDDPMLHDGSDALYWQSDSHHFVELVTSRDAGALQRNAYPYVAGVLIRDIAQPIEVRRLPVPEVAKSWASDYYAPPVATQHGELMTWAPVQEATTVKTLAYVPFGSDGTVKTVRIAAPSGATFDCANSQFGRTIAVSPGGDRITWLGWSGSFSPLKEQLERLLPIRIDRQHVNWVSLFVAATDGSGIIEVGRFEFHTEDETRTEWPGEIRWLPDGHHLSFELGGALYTVPVD